MALKRMIVELGMGTDLTGADYTKAAVRALKDALWHNSLTIAPAMGKKPQDMHVKVLIGVPQPDKVDKAAVAAVLYSPINLVYPAMGHLVITKAFVIIILGGMGSFPGAIVGGLIIGLAEAFGGFYFSTDYKDLIAFVLLVVILSVRPQGLFSKGAH